MHKQTMYTPGVTSLEYQHRHTTKDILKLKNLSFFQRIGCCRRLRYRLLPLRHRSSSFDDDVRRRREDVQEHDGLLEEDCARRRLPRILQGQLHQRAQEYRLRPRPCPLRRTHRHLQGVD